MNLVAGELFADFVQGKKISEIFNNNKKFETLCYKCKSDLEAFLQNTKTQDDSDVLQFSNLDYANAQKFAQQHSTLDTCRILYKKYPNIISQGKLNIKSASTNDYYFDPSIKDKAILVEYEITKEHANVLSCVNGYWSQTKFEFCNKNTRQVDWNLDNFQESACGPPCFGLNMNKKNKNQPEDKSIQPRIYVNNGEVYFDLINLQWLLNAKLRRDGNNSTSIMNSIEEPFIPVEDVNVAGKYRGVKTKPYCQAYELSYNKDDEECYDTTSNWITYTIGDTLYKYGKHFLHVIENQSTKPENRPYSKNSLTNAQNDVAFDKWKYNINKDFKIPSFFGWDDVKNNNKLNHYNLTNLKFPIETELETLDINVFSNNDSDKKSIVDKITDIVEDLMKQFAFDFAFHLAGKMLIKVLDKFVTPVIKKVITHLSENLILISVKIISKVFSCVMARLAEKLLQYVSIQLIAILNLGDGLGEVLEVVDMIFLIATIMDIVLSFVDPWGFNSFIPNEYIPDILDRQKEMSANVLKLKNTKVTADWLFNILLTEEDLVEIKAKEILNTLFYLSSLKVNAYGQVIHKTDPFYVNFTNDDLMYTQKKKYLIKPHDLIEYETDHNKRMQNFNVFNKYSIIFLFGSMISIVFGIYLLSFVIFLIVVVINLLNYINAVYNIESIIISFKKSFSFIKST